MTSGAESLQYAAGLMSVPSTAGTRYLKDLDASWVLAGAVPETVVVLFEHVGWQDGVPNIAADRAGDTMKPGQPDAFVVLWFVVFHGVEIMASGRKAEHLIEFPDGGGRVARQGFITNGNQARSEGSKPGLSETAE